MQTDETTAEAEDRPMWSVFWSFACHRKEGSDSVIVIDLLEVNRTS
jgi:hypothetical protein